MAAVALAVPSIVCAETVGVFYDPDVAQLKFAANDVKSALESISFTVEMLPVASLNESYSNRKSHKTSECELRHVLQIQHGSHVCDTRAGLDVHIGSEGSRGK